MRLAQLSEIIQRRMGWCPNTGMVRAAPSVLSMPLGVMLPLEPDGSAGGSGRIGRGIEVLSGSIKTLNKEKRLLWFSVLTGLVIAFMFMAQYALHVLGSYPYEMISSTLGVVLTFCIELISVFCICLILAGLFLSRPADPVDAGVSIRLGLSKATTHARAFVCWSGIMAVLGTSVYLLIVSTGDLTIQSLITRFPFGYIVTPEIYGSGPIAGLFHIQYASLATIQMMIINVALFILTAFVIPVLVLEKKPLWAAIGESTRLMKKIWGEMLVCILLLGMVITGFSLISGIFQVIFSAVLLDSPFWYEFYYKGGWSAVAALYMAAWFTLILIITTISGIVIRNIYTCTTSGRMPGVPEGYGRKETSG